MTGAGESFRCYRFSVVVPGSEESLGLALTVQREETVPVGTCDTHDGLQLMPHIQSDPGLLLMCTGWDGGVGKTYSCFRRGNTGSPLWMENGKVLEHASNEFLTCC